MKQDLVRVLDMFEQLELALHDLDLGHYADTLVTMQEQMLEELEVDAD